MPRLYLGYENSTVPNGCCLFVCLLFLLSFHLFSYFGLGRAHVQMSCRSESECTVIKIFDVILPTQRKLALASFPGLSCMHSLLRLCKESQLGKRLLFSCVWGRLEKSTLRFLVLFEFTNLPISIIIIPNQLSSVQCMHNNNSSKGIVVFCFVLLRNIIIIKVDVFLGTSARVGRKSLIQCYNICSL